MREKAIEILEEYASTYSDFDINTLTDILTEIKRETAREILQKWYDENKAKGDEQDYVLELACENGVEVE